MNKELTEIIFLLDRSGSMYGLEEDTIGGYNSFLKSQKELGDNVIITTILFDDKYEILYNGVNIDEACLNDEDYYVRGGTALLDAIAKTILLVNERRKKIRINKDLKNDKEKLAEIDNIKSRVDGEKVIFVITTDGMENSSYEFSREKVNEMVSEQENKYGWQFLYFGANVDIEEEADSIGIDEDSRFEFEATSEGYCMMMEELDFVVKEIRGE